MLATQNPIEQEGTYPLPEAQLDRFMFNVVIDYPTAAEERRILAQTTTGDEPAAVAGGDGAPTSSAPRQLVRDVAGGRQRRRLRRCGSCARRGRRRRADASPEFVRAVGALGRRAARRAGAAARRARRARVLRRPPGACRSTTSARVAPPVLRHRVLVNFQAEADGIDAETIVARLLDAIPPLTL